MPSDAVLIRPARPDDHAAWLPLWEGYDAFYGGSGPTALPEAVTRLTWQRFFDGDEPMHALVGRAGRPVGFAHHLFHRSTILAGPTCYLQDLFTAPECRGAGIGRALIEAVYGAVATDPGSVVYRRAL